VVAVILDLAQSIQYVGPPAIVNHEITGAIVGFDVPRKSLIHGMAAIRIATEDHSIWIMKLDGGHFILGNFGLGTE